MSLQVVVMVAVSTVLLAAGVVLLLRLGAATTSERQVYAFRMTGIMLASAGLVLGVSAGAMWSWGRNP